MNGRLEVCECGHHKDTHFLDYEREGEHPPTREPREFRGACNGMHCDPWCKRYREKKTP